MIRSWKGYMHVLERRCGHLSVIMCTLYPHTFSPQIPMEIKRVKIIPLDFPAKMESCQTCSGAPQHATGAQGYLLVPGGSPRVPARIPGVPGDTYPAGTPGVPAGYPQGCPGVPGDTYGYPRGARGQRGGAREHLGVPRDTPRAPAGCPRGTRGVPWGTRGYRGGVRAYPGEPRGYPRVPPGQLRGSTNYPVVESLRLCA